MFWFFMACWDIGIQEPDKHLGKIISVSYLQRDNIALCSLKLFLGLILFNGCCWMAQQMVQIDSGCDNLRGIQGFDI